MAILEQQFVIHTEHTQYRVRPNPDSDAPNGRDGIVLEWRDAGDEKWCNYFLVAPDAVPSLISSLQTLMKDV